MTTNILSLVLLAFALSMDAFSVCVGYGVCYKKANGWSAFRLSFATAFFQGMMPLIGWFGGTALGKHMQHISPVIAFILLLIIGIKMFVEAFEVKEECDIYDISRGKHLLMVAVATSIDALAAGITVGILNIPVLFSVSVIAGITFVMSFSGVFIGKAVGNFIGKWAEIAGGIIIVIVGCKILIEGFIL